jgi:hypothetical protein
VEIWSVSDLWTFIRGASTVRDPGSYDTKGVSLTTNNPTSRSGQHMWFLSNKQQAFVFGGYYFNTTVRDDFWRPVDLINNSWIWLGGQRSVHGSGIFGTLGLFGTSFHPPSYMRGAYWSDSFGDASYLIMFSGQGVSQVLKQALWAYWIETGAWAWIGGLSNSVNGGTFGPKGDESTTYLPKYIIWTTSAHKTGTLDSFFLYGGWLSNSAVGDDLWSLRIKPDRCPIGYYGQGVSCLPCSVGTYTVDVNSTSCMNCSSGLYSNSLASSVCTSCSAGLFTSINGSIGCEQCPVGTFSIRSFRLFTLFCWEIC